MSAEAGMTSPQTSAPRPANTQQSSGNVSGTSGHGSAIRIRGSPSKYVKLNVGGALHYTTIDTLTKQDNMLRAMFSGRMEVLTDSEGWILIDRCGRHFGTILNFLRDGKVCLPESKIGLEELFAEAKYYLVQELAEKCQGALKYKREEYAQVCHIPVITSQHEARTLISATSKPIVKFLYNRQNNKYSYTSNSDDNILKNIEMFDKLSVRFNQRIMFIKDIRSSSEEICCWTFYGRGHKVAEISCTSIVYTSEKKQTKVEFPEARVLEETLNVLLHEKVDNTEDEQRLSPKAAAPTSGSQSEDEEESVTRPR